MKLKLKFMGKMLEERRGNLLDCRDHIAHCVAIDMEMGAGVASQIRKKFISSEEIQNFTTMKPKIGECFIVETDVGKIFNVVTKPSSRRSRPTKEGFKLAIDNLFELMNELGVRKINIPKLGCGLDRLSWDGFVKPLLQQKVSLGFDIIVWVI